MHQTRKGLQWHFGMKLHIGVDKDTGLAHSAVVTAANVHDKHPLPDLLHGQETEVYGDSAYASQHALIASKVADVFAVVKRLWGFNKARYRGLAKNATRAFVCLGLANIYLARRFLNG